MSQGQNAGHNRSGNKEWWGKRPYSGLPVSWRSKTNKFFKRQVHKIERFEGRKIIESELQL